MSGSGKGKRNSLSLKRKVELIDLVENSGERQINICRRFGIPTNTMSDMMKRKEHLKQQFYSGQVNVNRKHDTWSQHHDIERRLLKWFTAMRAADVPINGISVSKKANEIAAELGKGNWSCNEGWLWRFKRRHNISFRNAEAEQWSDTVLSAALKRYQPRDVFNADETGLFWHLLPDKVQNFKGAKYPNGERAKDRLTVLCCTNMDGSEKWPLFVIGKFVNPGCFKGLKNLPTKYSANKMAWMTSDFFSSWVVDFDRNMAQQGRKVLLVVDNCSAHVKLSNLQATELLFLPPNATSRIQPSERGIIFELKTHYRQAFLTKLLNHIDSGLKLNDFQISLLDAITILKISWSKVTQETIQHCFKKAGFGETYSLHELSQQEKKQKRSELQPLLSQLYEIWNVSLTVEDIVCVDDELSISPPSECEEIQINITNDPAVANKKFTISLPAELEKVRNDTSVIVCNDSEFSISPSMELQEVPNDIIIDIACEDHEFSLSPPAELQGAKNDNPSASISNTISGKDGAGSETPITIREATAPHITQREATAPHTTLREATAPQVNLREATAPCITLREATASVEKLSLFLLQRGCGEGVSLPFTQFKTAFESFKRQTLQTKITSFFKEKNG